MEIKNNNKEKNIWGIHAGRSGDADKLFLKDKCIALGWDKIGDLAAIKPPDRETFKDKIAKAYPENKPGAIPNNAGQLFRFVYEMKKGDYVVYSSKIDKQLHIGQIESEYLYDSKRDSGYPHQRNVKWLQTISRKFFSQGALYEVGSAMSFFQIKNYADEFTAVINGKKIVQPVVDDETVVAHISEDIETNTVDFILKRIAQKLKGHPFAHFVAHLLSTMGYRTRVSPEGPDGGIDIIAHKDELGVEPPIIKVQVKSSDDNIGDPSVTALYGKVTTGEFGLFVTLGSYTPQAKTFARGKSNLRLIDGEELVNLILEHYEQFNSQYKGLLPLKKVYVPEPLDEE